ncbi:ribonuclease H protein, partial [Trifolium medium]|nr:ribonuclease H protein [Trifolium medium]
WVRAFAGNIGFSNILHAELLTMYHGLNLAWELDIKDMICYSDSKTAINLIEKPINEWHHFAAILHNIKDLLAMDWRVTVVHTLREGNACADYLAKLGARNVEVFSLLATLPVGIKLFLLADASGSWFTR